MFKKLFSSANRTQIAVMVVAGVLTAFAIPFVSGLVAKAKTKVAA